MPFNQPLEGNLGGGFGASKGAPDVLSSGMAGAPQVLGLGRLWAGHDRQHGPFRGLRVRPGSWTGGMHLPVAGPLR